MMKSFVLVERDDEDMATESEQPKNDGSDNSSPTNVTASMESEQSAPAFMMIMMSFP